MNREEMLQKIKEQDFVSEPLYESFKAVDRGDFVPESLQSSAYENRPLPIGQDQTISQPYTVAFMLSLLEPRPGESLLDIGSGSGYTTALLAGMVGDEGFVKGLEIIDNLVEYGRRNLAKYDFEHAVIEQAEEDVLGDPGSRYDKILVSAAAEAFPERLLDQLRPHGVLVIPVRDEIWRVERDEDALEGFVGERHKGFRFVPLRHSQDTS